MKLSLFRKRGMTLVEIMIVVVVLGVILAAVFLLFTRGTREFHFGRRQNELDIAGRQALEAMTNSIIWAGYMPLGGWQDADWHPVSAADSTSFEFYADWEEFKILEPTDYRTIELLPSGNIQIKNEDDEVLVTAGENITDLQFEYLDENGTLLGNQLDTEELRDQVRHIQIRIELTDEYADDIYQTEMQTTVSPRNLGINHDINPGFYPPEPPIGRIVFNVDADTTGMISPDNNQEAMINRLSYWGYTLTMLTDNMLPVFDYTGINLIILRNMSPGVHTCIPLLESLPIPIITMNAQEAATEFGMGSSWASIVDDTMEVVVVDHPVNRNLPSTDPFAVYEDPAIQSVLLDFPNHADSTYLITRAGAFYDSSGVSAINMNVPQDRVVHYAPWVATEYTFNGWRLFRNVIEWGIYIPEDSLGTPITELEDFEGPEITEQYFNIWEDPIIPSAYTDTVAIYFEDFTNTPLGGEWELASLDTDGRCGVVTEGMENFLRMDRSSAGSDVRNLGILTLDLSAFDESTDDLVLRVDTRAGTFEGLPDSDDGIFFWDVSGAAVPVASVDFSGGKANEDLEFWGDLYGRYRIHSPVWPGGTEPMITFDSRVNGQSAQNRMMIEVSTTGFTDGEDVNVSYLFHDHGDLSSPQDFLGWNSSGDITGSYTEVTQLNPASYANDIWHHRLNTFTPATLPDPIYIIFGQQGDQRAADFSSSGGISLDDIEISIGSVDTLYTKFADPSTAAGWNNVVVDLDDAAVLDGVPFDSAFDIVFSQYGSGTWDSYGRSWDNVEVCILEENLASSGWTHDTLVSTSQGYTGIDDWEVDDDGFGDYFWGLHGNISDSYSEESYCYLQSPLVTIPDMADNVELTFDHRYVTDNNDQGGFMQISVDGGAWTYVSLPDYDGSCGSDYPGPAGTDIFHGNSGGWQTVDLDLTSYAGSTVRFRFIFGSDAENSGGNWQLDDFQISAHTTAWEVESIEFLATSYSGTDSWVYDDIDIWMGYGPDTAFTSGGMWNTGDMQLVAENYVLDADWTFGDSVWNQIVLDTPFFLPEGQNFMLKLTKHNSLESSDMHFWGCMVTPENTVRHSGGTTPPVFLSVDNYLPAIKLNTTTGTLTSIGPDGENSYVPFDSQQPYSHMEAIFSADYLGVSSVISWTHGGDGDDWEFGAPVFVPDIDPYLTYENGNAIAGTDLTDNGRYQDQAYAYLISCAYEMPSVVTGVITMRFDRCVRLAPMDIGHISLGFSATTDPPPLMSTDWNLIRTYNDNQSYWNTEDLIVTSEFQDAASAGMNYFFVRFIIDSNTQDAFGGWNLDNVQFFGNN